VRWVRRIQPLLPAIQRVAMALSQGSMRTRTALSGKHQADQGQQVQRHTPEQGVEQQQQEGNDTTHDRRKESKHVQHLNGTRLPDCAQGAGAPCHRPRATAVAATTRRPA
jgi:hypothetical protein